MHCCQPPYGRPGVEVGARRRGGDEQREKAVFRLNTESSTYGRQVHESVLLLVPRDMTESRETQNCQTMYIILFLSSFFFFPPHFFHLMRPEVTLPMQSTGRYQRTHSSFHFSAVLYLLQFSLHRRLNKIICLIFFKRKKD